MTASCPSSHAPGDIIAAAFIRRRIAGRRAAVFRRAPARDGILRHPTAKPPE